jgi:phosphoglycerate dehydrogenase-like enzyme
MKVLVYTVWPVPFWMVPKSQVARLREQFPDVTFFHATSEADALREVEDADVALSSHISAAMVQRGPRLRWVHSTAAAVNILPLAELASREILVTNSRGIQAIAIAEHAIGGLLVLARRLDLTLAAQRERRWIQNELTGDAWPWTLHRLWMTIVGLGTIGVEVAKRAHAFGMRVTAVRRRSDRPKPEFCDRVFGADHLDDALRGCDVLVLAAPPLPETDRLISSPRLALLNEGAIVVNVARGRIIDEAALISGLQDGRLGGAVLDVFDREPLPAASPLWTLPNVVITPHCSGVREDHWIDAITLFGENLRRYRSGEPLINMVDPRAGY